jgi:hypothetical protein
MNIKKYFCKTVENVEVPAPQPVQQDTCVSPIAPEPVEPLKTESEKDESVIQVAKETTDTDITETDPGTMSITNDSATLTDDGGIIIQNQTSPEPKNIHKLKPASKYTIGKPLSMAYLSPDRYYFIKCKYNDKIELFGKCIKFDKFDNKKVIFRISDTNELNIFEYNLFYFYRAVPKK